MNIGFKLEEKHRSKPKTDIQEECRSAVAGMDEWKDWPSYSSSYERSMERDYGSEIVFMI